MLLPLFVYGTLRDVDLAATVLGRPLRHGMAHAAAAPGFRAVQYPGRVYPALVRTPGAAAIGLLITDLTPFELDLLDAWEGDDYRRQSVAAILADEPELHEAEAYLPTRPLPADAHDWSLSRWQQQHKARAMVSGAAEAARLRERLIAIRPN
jgi:gamma-glutamylcyclotransferase (GGCT)/AIG2-like uncharacterized protein YtfP